jgi:hypothetical protein
MLVTIAYSAWLLGREPWQRIICVSYSESLAKAHARAFRTIVTSDWFRQAFPAFQIARNGAELDRHRVRAHFEQRFTAKRPHTSNWQRFSKINVARGEQSADVFVCSAASREPATATFDRC